MKAGDKVVRTGNNFYEVFTGEQYRVKEVSGSDITLNTVDGRPLSGLYVKSSFVVIPDAVEKQEPNYAAAFNMWQDDFCNNPQAYEDSQTVAIRHLTEKLNGEEPSYGQIAAQMLIEYLNKLESK